MTFIHHIWHFLTLLHVFFFPLQTILTTLPRTPCNSSSVMTTGVSHQDMQDLHSGIRTRGVNTQHSDRHTLHPDTHTHQLPCTSPLPALTLLHLLTLSPHPTSLSIPLPLLLPLSSTHLSLVLSGHQTSLTSLLLPHHLLLLSDAICTHRQLEKKTLHMSIRWLSLFALLVWLCNQWL